ncbi:FMN-binding negative transcriptional regulator [Pedobacter sp. AW31-3R]|uniref:FMN-binding negative transcriptional regulator n=1 Tax=Pedobacter sp. AW31-3R TaxID=3445781 RepID=UPI003FA14886
MYTPNLFQFTNDAEKIAFMKRYSFATMVTLKGDIPIATQLPFYIDHSSDKLVLSAHFAVANEQAGYLEASQSLVIFSEPHAYISPKHYDKRESVPTWNYMAVHAYGKAKVIQDENAKIKVLEQLITFHDEAYLEQWNSLSDKYKQGMLKGIVAFEMEVTDLQGQKKISQNKSESEKQRIIKHLNETEHTVEKDIAAYMGKISSNHHKPTTYKQQ